MITMEEDVDMIRCVNCGQKNRREVRICWSCGENLTLQKRSESDS